MEITREQAERHNALTKAASTMVEKEMILSGSAPTKLPGFFLRRRLGKAIQLYEQALEINPEGWSSMWVLGKIHQRLGDQATAYTWFAKAHQLKPSQPDVAREAGLAALDCGHIEAAVHLCLAAVKLSPDDFGLQSNLALAYLFAGDNPHADECARAAVQGAPDDPIAKAVFDYVREVSAGIKQRPARLSDVFPVR